MGAPNIEDAGEDFIASIPKPCHNMLYQTTLINGAEVVAVFDEEEGGLVLFNREDGLKIESRSRVRPIPSLPARCNSLAWRVCRVYHNRS